MSQTFRRLYSLFAVLLFCIAAPLVVAWTSGYQFVGWSGGLSKVGAVYVSSEPKADVLLNGVRRGSTPLRLNRLVPGTYTLRLERSGYGAWERVVRVQGGLAQVLGPVILYPQSFSLTTISADPALNIADSQQRADFSLTESGGNWRAQMIWPENRGAMTLPWRPAAVTVNSTRQTSVFVHQDQAAIVTAGNDQPWLVPTPTNIQWDPLATTLFYGQRDGRLNRYDALTKTTTELGIADAYTVVGDTAWLAQVRDADTTIYKMKTFGQTIPETVEQVPGSWTIVPNPIAPLLQNTTTKELVRLQLDQLTGRVNSTSYGSVDRWWWTNQSESPLWLTGNELWTLDVKNQPQLLDRFAETLTAANWLVPEHILLTTDTHHVRIQSVSLQQGRGTILSWNSDDPIEVLGLNLNQRLLLAAVKSKTPSLLQLGW